MKFTKMHGCGNDYVYVNGFEETVQDPEKAAVIISDRHFGVGSDGLIIIRPSLTADCFMDMYNADGSRGKMCGNGIRCVAKYVYDHGMVRKKRMTVETLSGVKTLDLHVKDGKVETCASIWEARCWSRRRFRSAWEKPVKAWLLRKSLTEGSFWMHL